MNWEQKHFKWFRNLKRKIGRFIYHSCMALWWYLYKREIQTQEETSRYLMGYSENRIQHTQHSDLMHMYLKEFESLLKRFKELDKETLSAPTKVTDNEEWKTIKLLKG